LILNNGVKEAVLMTHKSADKENST